MKWNDGASLLGMMVVMIIVAVSIIGVIMVVTSMQDYYSPITNGTVDIGMNETIQTVTNMTGTMVDVGNNLFWLFFIAFFVALCIAVYAYTKR